MPKADDLTEARSISIKRICRKSWNKNEAEFADDLRRLDTTKVAKMSRFLCHCIKQITGQKLSDYYMIYRSWWPSSNRSSVVSSSVTLTIVTVVFLVTTLGGLCTCFFDDSVYCFTTDPSLSLESETKVISKDASVYEIEMMLKKVWISLQKPLKNCFICFWNDFKERILKAFD